MSPKTKSEDVSFLCLAGALRADGRVVLRPGFTTTNADGFDAPRDGELAIELVGADGRILVRHRAALRPACGEGSPSTSMLFATLVPMRADARELRFVRDGIVHHTELVPKGDPTVELLGRKISERQTKKLRWKGSHPEGLELHYVVRYSADDGRAWRPLCLPIRESELDVDWTSLPGGKRCRFEVLATDGIHTASARSPAFAVETRPCRAVIVVPEDGSETSAGQTVELSGHGGWLDGQRVATEEYSWSSSIDGELGRGARIRANGLSVGVHRIRLVTGVGSKRGEASISLKVRKKPSSKL